MEAAVLVSHSAFGKLECDFGVAAKLKTDGFVDQKFVSSFDGGWNNEFVEWVVKRSE